MSLIANRSPSAFPAQSPALEQFGLKFTPGGAHISRTMMLAELGAILSHVPLGSSADEYRSAVLQQNVLSKTTDSTRNKSLRHLRELYALDEATPLFGLLRHIEQKDTASLPLLALLTAWARDPLLRATTSAILDASEGDRVATSGIADALEAVFPDQYSELNRNKIARNAASSWTQSGHLAGRAAKTRRRIKAPASAVAMAFFLGDAAGYHGAAIYSNPWCRLLDLSPDGAKSKGLEAHRAGFLTLRTVGDVVDLTFPQLAKFQAKHA